MIEPKARQYPVDLIRVVDGDTVFLQVDLGFRTYGTYEFRLYGLNCPEMNTPEGQIAKRFTEDWFIKFGPAGQNARLLVDSYKNPEKYGRWLGVVYVEGGESLNAELVRTGNAVRYP